MNKKNMIGIALVALALAMTGVIATSAGEAAARFVGKAVWYVPYAAVVVAVRFFRAA